MEELEDDDGWLGEEEINSVYVDAISANYRDDSVRISFGQIVPGLVKGKRRIKVVQSVTTDPRTFKHVILGILNDVLKKYEEKYGEIEG